jgi:hypothetical protein
MSDDALLERISALEKQNAELKSLVGELKTELDATEKRLDQIEKAQKGGGGGGGGDAQSKPAEKAAKKKAAKAAAKAAGGGAADGGGKKKMTKKEEAADKAMKKAIKEGGKKGQDLQGMHEMGGMKYFTVAMESCEGSWELLEAAMGGANKEVDPEGDDRKGGAGNLGKCFLSCDESKHCAMYFHMKKELQGDLSLKEWATVMISSPDVKGEILEETDEYIKAIAYQSTEHQLFPLKQRDAAINCSFAMLKEKKLVMEDDEEEQDMGAMYEDLGIEW